MSEVSFLATIYRNISFDRDGGGKITLTFDAQQEVSVLQVLLMRHRLLRVTFIPVEGYGNIPSPDAPRG